jgi:gliding motility-associated-like protein
VLPPKITLLEGYEASICAGEYLDVRVQSTHGSNFKFSSSQEDALSNTAGFHTRFSPLPVAGSASLQITAISENVCPSADTFLTVQIKPMPLLLARFKATSGCAPFVSDIQLHEPTGHFPDQYRWISTAQIQSLGAHLYRFTGNEPGLYPLALYMELDGCIQTLSLPDSVHVFARPEAAFDVFPGTVIDWEYPTVTLQSNSVCPDSLKLFWTIQGQGAVGWTQRGERPVVNFPAPGDYDILLRAVSAVGCADESVRQVKVNPPLNYFVPNAFTPDGRLPEENNEFRVSIAEEVADFSLVVYDRWGQKVFRGELPETGWDGRNADGTVLPSGAYAWSLQFRTASGRAIAANGLVLLLR